MARRGSSILDLLAVIGIISLLIALLVPTFAKARQQARMVSCKAQLQNIGTALAVYLNENDGRFPPAPYSPTFNPSRRPLFNAYLEKCLADGQTPFHCPADGAHFERFGLSYSYAQELGEMPITDTAAYRALGKLAAVPVLWDAESFHGIGRPPCNWLFADGHVDGFLDDVPQRANPTTRPR